MAAAAAAAAQIEEDAAAETPSDFEVPRRDIAMISAVMRVILDAIALFLTPRCGAGGLPGTGQLAAGLQPSQLRSGDA